MIVLIVGATWVALGLLVAAVIPRHDDSTEGGLS
jgi:hypothetical protein